MELRRPNQVLFHDWHKGQISMSGIRQIKDSCDYIYKMLDRSGTLIVHDLKSSSQ